MARGQFLDMSGKYREVVFMRRPSSQVAKCAGTEIPHSVRCVVNAEAVQQEWDGYVATLRRHGVRVVELPSLEGRIFPLTGRKARRVRKGHLQLDPYPAADQGFTRDEKTQIPGTDGLTFVHYFHDQSRSRRPERFGVLEALNNGTYEREGIEIGTVVQLGPTEFVEGGDVDVLWVNDGVKSRWVTVIGRSARSNAKGIERIVANLQPHGIQCIVISVEKQVGSRIRKGMHWTTHGLKFGPDKIGLMPGYFSEADKRALRDAHIEVVELPYHDDQRWAANAKLSPLPGGKLCMFSDRRHVLVNEFLDKRGLKVVEVDLPLHLHGLEGGADCLANQFCVRATA